MIIVDIVSERRAMSTLGDEAMDRKEEIINACEKLYQTKSFKEINIKNISEETSFSRPSIYNYFETKEEIFLELLKREYRLWNEDLTKILDKEQLSKRELASELAMSISNRKNLLKLLAMNLYDIEENSSIESLTDFKLLFGEALNNVKKCLNKFVSDFNEEEIEKFIYSLFPFMYGIYPYTAVTFKQKEAMTRANVDYKFMTIYEISYNAILNMLKK